ncbi:hypothetical protein BJ912DRAFT_557268 [Pholiota molesta]|nr:hypothetical protein BJ912DRAFT_557268 [Pholiota molesta]
MILEGRIGMGARCQAPGCEEEKEKKNPDFVARDRPLPPESRFLSHLFTPPTRLCFRVALLQNFSHLQIGVCCRFYKSYQHISWRAVFFFFPILRCRFVLSLASKYLSFLHQSISKHVRRVRRDRPRSMCHTYGPLFFCFTFIFWFFRWTPWCSAQTFCHHPHRTHTEVSDPLYALHSCGAKQTGPPNFRWGRASRLLLTRALGRKQDEAGLLYSGLSSLRLGSPFSTDHQKSLSVAPSLPIGYFRVEVVIGFSAYLVFSKTQIC